MRSSLFVLIAIVVFLEGCFAIQHQVDPRRLLPDGNITYVNWQIGRRYRYEFTSRAAHLHNPLPYPDKVNPQTSLEDLGLFAYAVMEGSMSLECLCRPSVAEALFKVTMFVGKVQCTEQDTLKVNNNCTQLKDTANSLSKLAFWMTINQYGEVTGILFSPNELPGAIAIKKNIVGELSLTVPNPGDDPVMFVKNRLIGTAKYVTRYRVRPFARRGESTANGTAADNQRVEGLLVRKEKVATRPPLGKETINSKRDTWVYMVVGGDVSPESSPAPIPTRVVSIEQVRVDPAFMRLSSKDLLYVLSRLTLNLESIRPVTSAPPKSCVAPVQTASVRTADLS